MKRSRRAGEVRKGVMGSEVGRIWRWRREIVFQLLTRKDGGGN